MGERLLSIVISHREGEGVELTLDTLSRQTFKDFVIIDSPDQGKGANWARNNGFKQVNTPFVLFSDNDIAWKPGALEAMMDMLKYFPKASYSYGRYELNGSIIGHHVFDPLRLLRGNYISTMSIIRTKDFPGFDENIKRFQDWDLWLTLLKQGKRGVYCNDLIFSTPLREGISYMNPFTEDDALKVINDKHGLGLPQYNYA